jgi:hypothetical protein
VPTAHLFGVLTNQIIHLLQQEIITRVSPTSAPDPSKSSPDGTFATANEVDNANDNSDTFPHVPLQLFVDRREDQATVNEVSPVVVEFSEQL